LTEVGVAAASDATTLKRRLQIYAKLSWQQSHSAACVAHAALGSASLVLYPTTYATPSPRSADPTVRTK
jgi:hypothetical protein